MIQWIILANVEIMYCKMCPRKVRDSQCNSQWKGVPLHLGSRKEKLVFEAFKKSHCSYCPLVQHKWINEIEIDKWNWWIFPGSTTMQAHFRNPYTLSIKKSSPNLTSPPIMKTLSSLGMIAKFWRNSGPENTNCISWTWNRPLLWPATMNFSFLRYKPKS